MAVQQQWVVDTGSVAGKFEAQHHRFARISDCAWSPPHGGGCHRRKRRRSQRRDAPRSGWRRTTATLWPTAAKDGSAGTSDPRRAPMHCAGRRRTLAQRARQRRRTTAWRAVDRREYEVALPPMRRRRAGTGTGRPRRHGRIVPHLPRRRCGCRGAGRNVGRRAGSRHTHTSTRGHDHRRRRARTQRQTASPADRVALGRGLVLIAWSPLAACAVHPFAVLLLLCVVDDATSRQSPS